MKDQELRALQRSLADDPTIEADLRIEFGRSGVYEREYLAATSSSLRHAFSPSLLAPLPASPCGIAEFDHFTWVRESTIHDLCDHCQMVKVGDRTWEMQLAWSVIWRGSNRVPAYPLSGLFATRDYRRGLQSAIAAFHAAGIETTALEAEVASLTSSRLDL